MNEKNKIHVIVIGAGFTGLSAAYELVKNGIKVTVLEADPEIGGLAGSFKVNGKSIEKFYHHWFNNDKYIHNLINELGVSDRINYHSTKTGMYYANSFYKLSSPLDLMKFTPLNIFNRLRLGLMVLKARKINDWKRLEKVTAKEWILKTAGKHVYEIVWKPLLDGKFGPFSDEISAVWFWNKLILRGGSRGKRSQEVLAYFDGGFASLADILASEIKRLGGQILTNEAVVDFDIIDQKIRGVKTKDKEFIADYVISTPAIPIVANLLEGKISVSYLNKLKKINYLANVCLVLELDRSLSEIYWLNVNDPNFPFVGIIEHTNFQPSDKYDNRHIVYLSKYLPANDSLFRMGDRELLDFSYPFIKKMFPEFDSSWIQKHHVWRARYAQPIITRNYSEMLPEYKTPISNLYISTMAQIYPEDRGTNYAVREGKKVADSVIKNPVLSSEDTE